MGAARFLWWLAIGHVAVTAAHLASRAMRACTRLAVHATTRIDGT